MKRRTAARALHRLMAVMLALAGWLGQGAAAWAATCAPAAMQGTAPSDYRTYCWLDMTGYAENLATGAAGQNFSYTLSDGSVLSFNLKVTESATTQTLAAWVVPSWFGAAFGNKAFIAIPGRPVLYQQSNAATTTTTITLSNIAIAPPTGVSSSVPYSIIVADGESTSLGETLSFKTNGAGWALVQQISNGTTNFPSVTGYATSTVKETGQTSGSVGSYVFSSANSPTTITATLSGNGKQGVLFGVRFAAIGVTAQISGVRINPADQFGYRLNAGSDTGNQLATNMSIGNGLGPFPQANAPLIAAGYSVVLNETMAPGSVSALSDYLVSLSCTNSATASPTVMPANVLASTYTFSQFNFGDNVVCTFTNRPYVLVSGKVFADTGVGTGGVGNNGLPDGGEAGLSGITVNAVVAGAVVGSAVTDGSGVYVMGLPRSVDLKQITITPVAPSGYQATGGSAGSSGGSYARPSVSFNASQGLQATGVNFGLVPAATLAPDGQQNATPGSEVFYPHLFTAGSAGQVTFGTSATASPALMGWAETLYRDANCNGQIDANDALINSALTVAVGARVCVVLRQFVPATAPPGAQNKVTFSATFAYTNANPALTATLSRTDTTIVVAAGTAQLSKLVTNLTKNGSPGTSNAAAIGDTLRYDLQVSNLGSSPIGELVVDDSTPAFTQFVSATCPTTLPAGLTACAITTQPALNGRGALVWTFTGSLASGASTTVSFTVKVSP